MSFASSSGMEVLVSEQGGLKQYSNDKDIDGVSNASMVASKRRFSEIMPRRNKKSKSGDDKKDDDSSLMSRTRPSSNKGHVNRVVELASGKKNLKKRCNASNIERDSEDEFVMDEFEEGEMMFLFKLKGRSRSRSRSRSSDVKVTEENTKDESRNSISSPPSSPNSSANNNTVYALRNMKVTSQFVDLNFD